MKRGHIKRVFPGGNTSLGFFSFYDYIAPPDATRIFVIKGGPGVGKSTFIRGIGEALVARGLDIEFHHCSSDNNSLDGLYIPAIKVALIDGTAPQSAVTNVDARSRLGSGWTSGPPAGHRAAHQALVSGLRWIGAAGRSRRCVRTGCWCSFVVPGKTRSGLVLSFVQALRQDGVAAREGAG